MNWTISLGYVFLRSNNNNKTNKSNWLFEFVDPIKARIIKGHMK